jgi:hypothetical protein
MYPNIRQEFFTNLSSQKCKVTLQLLTNMFCTSILLKNEDYEGGLSYIWVNMACDFNKFHITNIWFLVFLLIIMQENTVMSVLHNFGRYGDLCILTFFIHTCIMLLLTAMIHISVPTQYEYDYLYVT